MLIFSGAVSKGKFDFIPEVLNELGVEKLFHQVKQRPGKPFWFGTKTTAKDKNNKIEKYHGYTSMFMTCSHPHLVPYGLNQWAHTATQLYTNTELAQNMG